MSWRIVVVSSSAKVDYKAEYLVIRTLDCTKRIHMSEIGVVVLDEGDHLAALLKIVGIRLSLDGLTEMEALIEHIGIYEKILRSQCIVLIGAKQFFAPEELETLYQMAFYRKWNLMLLEACKRENLPNESHILIDCDLCEIRVEDT